jgi:two-component system sensor histidine kinase RegB
LEQAIKNNPTSKTILEDLSLIRNEVDRCSLIIDLMKGNVDDSESLHTEFSIQKIHFALAKFLGKDFMQYVEFEGIKDLIIRNISMSELIQIILPLIKNGVEASEKDMAKVKVALVIKNGISVLVDDNGPGVDPKILQFIENPFFTTKEPGKGLGMGLFLSRVVADRVGVALEYKNKTNGGFCVILKLPSTCECSDE